MNSPVSGQCVYTISLTDECTLYPSSATGNKTKHYTTYLDDLKTVEGVRNKLFLFGYTAFRRILKKGHNSRTPRLGLTNNFPAHLLFREHM